MPLISGTRLGSYEVLAPLGAGGMGEVYRARDTRLKRDVAIKVLPEDFAADPEWLARFEREATTVAGLNHPNIVTLHSVEEIGGTRFLTMELVEGRSLNHVIPRGGLPIPRVVDIGIALADALAAAHARGIVHRDLKPANVMLTKDGRVKVLDFGLAKLVQDAPAAHSPEATSAPTAPEEVLTSPGMMIGTVPYMSPERVIGTPVDARADLFSLGVVLYEMATGERPFRGGSSAEIISSILRDVPSPVTETRHDAPRDLARILDRCLQKDPESRFQTAKDVRSELQALRKEMDSGESATRAARSAVHTASGRAAPGRSKALWIVVATIVVAAVAVVLVFRGRATRPSGEAAGPDSKSIAVLPFVNMSSDKEQEYFSDGISEELLNFLAKIPELKVTARTSSFSFKGKEVGIPEIARQLHVAHVLEGSVRKSGDQVRITAQLIHAADGFQLWSETYDRKLDDVFKIQDEIAGEVVKHLRVTLLGGAVPKARTTDPKAYALYLQARQLCRQFTAEAFAKSDSLYRQVLEIDPRYAPAWNGLASNLINEVNYGMGSAEGGWTRAREAAEKALTIDPDDAAAWSQLGSIAMYADNDLIEASKRFERALALDPANLAVLGSAANFLGNVGRQDDALALREAIVRRDPVNVTWISNLGGYQLFVGRYDAAIASFHTVLNLSPGSGGAHFGLAVALLRKGDPPAALAEFEQETIDGLRMIGLPIAYHALGRKADSDAALAALISKYGKDWAYNIAYVYAFRGEADEAFEWLEKAVKSGDPGLSEILAERLFDNLHSDPRWLPFLRKIGKAPEQLAKIEFKVTLPKDL